MNFFIFLFHQWSLAGFIHMFSQMWEINTYTYTPGITHWLSAFHNKVSQSWVSESLKEINVTLENIPQTCTSWNILSHEHVKMHNMSLTDHPLKSLRIWYRAVIYALIHVQLHMQEQLFVCTSSFIRDNNRVKLLGKHVLESSLAHKYYFLMIKNIHRENSKWSIEIDP